VIDAEGHVLSRASGEIGVDAFAKLVADARATYAGT
jgi:hypothetical protein